MNEYVKTHDSIFRIAFIIIIIILFAQKYKCNCSNISSQ